MLQGDTQIVRFTTVLGQRGQDMCGKCTLLQNQGSLKTCRKHGTTESLRLEEFYCHLMPLGKRRLAVVAMNDTHKSLRATFHETGKPSELESPWSLMTACIMKATCNLQNRRDPVAARRKKPNRRLGGLAGYCGHVQDT